MTVPPRRSVIDPYQADPALVVARRHPIPTPTVVGLDGSWTPDTARINRASNVGPWLAVIIVTGIVVVMVRWLFEQASTSGRSFPWLWVQRLRAGLWSAVSRATASTLGRAYWMNAPDPTGNTDGEKEGVMGACTGWTMTP